MSALARFVALYALMYAAFGVASPFMPSFFEARGLTPGQLGALFGAGTAVRLIAAPLCARLADGTGALRVVLASCELLAAVVALGLLRAPAFTPLFAMSLLDAAVLAPTTTLADALAVSAALPRAARRGFEYGWVRGAGSAFFVVGTLAGGQVVAAHSPASAVLLQAALLAAASAATGLLPKPVSPVAEAVVTRQERPTGVIALLRVPLFRRLMLVSALVLGSHAMHDTFAVIRWRAAGVGPATVSVLWSESVAAEVLVFFLIGPALVARLGPAGLIAIAAAAGVVRWVVMATTTDLIALALIQPLHGLTFAALHLASMRIVAAIVPQQVAARAQAIYAVSAGITTALTISASGTLYELLGARGFLAMALLCAVAAPLAPGLRTASTTRLA